MISSRQALHELKILTVNLELQGENFLFAELGSEFSGHTQIDGDLLRIEKNETRDSILQKLREVKTPSDTEIDDNNNLESKSTE